MGHLTQETTAERAARVKTLNDALIEWVMKVAQGRVGQFSTAVPGLDISVRDERNASERCVYRRSLGVMLSGRKRSIVGNRVYEYGAGDMLYTLVDMPAMWQVVGATKEHPFIAVSIALDEEVLRELIPRVRLGSRCTNLQAIGLERSDPDLLEVFLRLMQLLDRPDEIEVMAPMLLREIHFRALLGPQGPALAPPSRRIRRATASDRRSSGSRRTSRRACRLKRWPTAPTWRLRPSIGTSRR